MTNTTASEVAGTTPDPQLQRWTTWEGILPTRRPPVVLSIVLFVTMLVQGLGDPIAFVIDGRYEWPNPIPFELSVLLLVVLCAAQAASLLLTTRWPLVAVLVTVAVYAGSLLLLNAPTWVAPMQLAIVAALFLLSTRNSPALTLPLLAGLVAVHLVALFGWSNLNGLTPGVVVGIVLAQSAGYAAGLAGAVVLGLWWGAQTRRVAQMRAQAEAERRDQEERLMRARDAERARIAQELHDVAAQHITGLLSLTDAALTVNDEYSPGARTLIAEARSEARFAAASLFSALAELRAAGPARADTTPDATRIGELVAFWRPRNVRVRMRTSGELDSLPAMISATAYRIVQESLTNVAKHAPGASVDLSLAVSSDRLEVDVVNAPSRRGLPEVHAVGLGWGLKGLRQRVTLLGGTLTIGPTELGGWRVHATVPITDAAREPGETESAS